MIKNVIRKEQEVFEAMQLSRDNYREVGEWLFENGIDSYLYEDKEKDIFQLRYEDSLGIIYEIDESYYMVKNEYYELELLDEEEFTSDYREVQNER